MRVDEPPASAKRLLDAVVDSGAHQIMVLPNGLMAAEELVAVCAAARGWGITVIPLPSASMAQGLAALAVHDPERMAVDDSYTMARRGCHPVWAGAGGHRACSYVVRHL